MTSKLKSMLRRQTSPPVNRDKENIKGSSAIMEEMKNVRSEFFRGQGDETSLAVDGCDNVTNEDAVLLRKKKGIRRHNTSLGAIEDLLQCPICKGRLKSPRMMPCQHTFCEKCLEEQMKNRCAGKPDIGLTCPLCDLRVTDRSPNLLPTNLYIESLLHVMENPGEGLLGLASRNPVVTFAPLPERVTKSVTNGILSRSSASPIFCNKCSIACAKDNRCKHCKQTFCDTCWAPHVDDLKGQLEKIVPQLETASNRFEKKIENLRSKVDARTSAIEKDVEARVAELLQERDDRIRALLSQADRNEEIANEIQRQMIRVTDEMKEQINGMYEKLTDNRSKVKTFVALYREATELLQLDDSWDPELGDSNIVDKSHIIPVDLTSQRDDGDLSYRQKSFSPKCIVSRELVERPAGMAHDPSRDHVFVACPGARQIVVLDKKYKLLKRYQSKEMMAPQGVAYVENTEELFVTDKWKNCIIVFNRKGEIVRQIWQKGEGESQLSGPEGLTYYAPYNLLYVADTGNDRVQILELNGTFRGCIGPNERRANGFTKSGKLTSIAINHLNQPTDVAVTEHYIIVADCGNHKVKIFNHDGILVQSLGGSGTLRRHFRSPEVVEVDNKGNIIVGDSGNARVQIFSPQGELLKVLGGRNSKTNKFGWISGLLMKNNCSLMIGDNKNNIIKIF